MSNDEKYAGIIYSKWAVSCGECCGEIEQYGVAHHSARPELIKLGWNVRGGLWYCPQCLKEMDEPKQLSLEQAYNLVKADLEEPKE